MSDMGCNLPLFFLWVTSMVPFTECAEFCVALKVAEIPAKPELIPGKLLFATETFMACQAMRTMASEFHGSFQGFRYGLAVKHELFFWCKVWFPQLKLVWCSHLRKIWVLWSKYLARLLMARAPFKMPWKKHFEGSELPFIRPCSFMFEVNVLRSF